MPGGRHFGVPGEIVGAIEERMRASPFKPPHGQEMEQRALVSSDLRLPTTVIVRVEEWVRTSALGLTGLDVVDERIPAFRGDIRVHREIPLRIEERIRLKPDGRASLDIVNERIESGSAHVGMTR